MALTGIFSLQNVMPRRVQWRDEYGLPLASVRYIPARRLHRPPPPPPVAAAAPRAANAWYAPGQWALGNLGRQSARWLQPY